tara:strand:- start:870 stop:1046 length:177 start_codon:yes stop_codon:yes gene_type:complete
MTDGMQNAVLKACIAALESSNSDYIVARECGLNEEELEAFYQLCRDQFDKNTAYPEYK